MNKTRTAAKWFATTVAVTALVLGSMSAPAQAKDSGWGVMVESTDRDSGWG